MKKAIGIDLGTTNSAVAFKDVDVKIIRSKENEELVPSCVSLINEEITVGRIAYNTGLQRNPQNTILSVKRLMGGSIKDNIVQEMIANKKYYKFGITELEGGTNESLAILLGGKQYTPEEISAEILKKLKNDSEEKLGDKVTHAVITVPAYFTEKQKNATRIAAQLAGLKLQKLLAEPTAAAIAYGVDNMKIGDSRTVLVYDFGGGTFDLSILNIVDGQYIEAGTSGDRWLGGDDIDRKLVELIYKKVEFEYNIESLESLINSLQPKKRDAFEGELKVQTEKVKIELSSVNNSDIFIPNYLEDENGDIIDIEFEISRVEFESLVRPIIQKTIYLIDELLKEVGYEISMIDSILLVGGTACIPLVKEMLASKYGFDKIKMSEKPMLVVAEGAGILSHRLGGEYEAPLEITDTVDDISCSTNHNYFIQYQTKDGNFDFRKIIEKHMPLPVRKSDIFKTTVNNQRIAKLVIYTDKEGNEKEEMTTSFFTIDKDLPIQSEIVFDIELDTDEIFSIKAYPKGQKYLSKDVIIGRGKKDSRAFKTIEKYTKEILKNISSWRIQEKYFIVQEEMIKFVEEIGNEKPIDSRWAEIDFKIKNAFDETMEQEKIEQEGNREENIIDGAYMLIEKYNTIMRFQDVQYLSDMLKEYANAEPFSKAELVSKIDKITDNYIDLFALNKLKYAVDIAINGHSDGTLGETNAITDANYLKEKHDEILNCFKNGKNDEGYNLLNESMVIAKKYI